MMTSFTPSFWIQTASAASASASTSSLAHKALLSLVYIVALLIVRALLGLALRAIERGGATTRRTFGARQAVSLLTLVALVAGLVYIWFDDPARFASVLGLLSAGVAIALQRVITSFAAYLIILRGKIFTVGDRITIGGVRGDVVSLGFMQTTVMEMGESPRELPDAPAIWVHARQYTGRIVRVTNDRVFDSPVYNLTREFPYVWEEMAIPVSYKDDRARAESIILDCVRRHVGDVERRARDALEALRRRYPLAHTASVEPRVYWRLTDNWVELSARFVVDPRAVRGVKDAISRDIIAALDTAKIGIASATSEIVGLPPVRVELQHVDEGRRVEERGNG